MTTDKEKGRKARRYGRLYDQIETLLKKCELPRARMASVASVLHHKMDKFFWTGFYLLEDGELIVGNYQGPVACMVLAKDTGVCWAAVNAAETVVVEDVHKFPGHIACDSRSNSEIVVPLRDKSNNVVGVLDIDSQEFSSFDEIDAEWLEKIVGLIYK
ncbi:GAF domain-containing protein [Puteibacter caeruleilacunae]|nr:GAF domain-containing protein [Puteibacter caeruleilacunae]